jgi:predicted dehydrogenase
MHWPTIHKLPPNQAISMDNSHNPSSRSVSRRNFLQTSAVVGAGALAAMHVPQVHAANGDDFVVKIGLIGCGGRGTGALMDCIGAATKVIYPKHTYHTEDVAEGAKVANKNIQVIALADMFENRMDDCHRNLQKVGYTVPKEHQFLGIHAYKKLLAIPDINYVILATPPHFRPTHVKAAVEAGKNVFMEKPAAVDVPGIKTVLEAGKLAKEKGLGIVAGTQRRHAPNYRETIQRIHDGAIGEIAYAKAYWNGGEIWVIDREPGWSDMEWQIRNWNYFTWLSGDHYVEQHVHNLDVMNWVIGAHPIKAVSGLGGRQSRLGDRHGQIFDHFAVEFEYPGGITVFSQARQINNCKNIVAEFVAGTKGKSDCATYITPNSGDAWEFKGAKGAPYQLEHADLIASIREGKPLNEAQNVAESTMTGILGREACYSGQEVTWDEAMKSTTRLGPKDYKFGPNPVAPVAQPGKYRFT